MKSRIERTWFSSALAILAVIGVCNREASGAAVNAAKGIVITGSGGPVAGTDPLFTYTFRVYVADDFALTNGDYFTFSALAGVTAAGESTPVGDAGSFSTVSSPFNTNTSIAFSYPTITPVGYPDSSATYPYSPTDTFTSNVTWTYFGSSPIVGAGPDGTYVGTFSMETYVQLTSILPTVTYSAQSHNYDSSLPDPIGTPYTQGPGGDGPAVEINVVPEPASIVLLVGGAGVLPAVLVVQRRRSRLAADR